MKVKCAQCSRCNQLVPVMFRERDQKPYLVSHFGLKQFSLCADSLMMLTETQPIVLWDDVEKKVVAE